MLKTHLLLLYIVSSFEIAFSQENYQHGYIVNLNKDTIRGLIDYRGWKVSPKSISFKENMASNKVQFTAKDIRAFEVSDDQYIRAVVQVEVENPNESNPQMELNTEVVFLQAILKGPKSFYVYESALTRALFYIKRDTTFDLLVYKSVMLERPDGRFEQKNNRYYGQLQVYLENCPGIVERIKNMNYTEEDLEKLFSFYYKKCTKMEISSVKKKEKIKTEFGLMAGAVWNSINFAGVGTGVGISNDFLLSTTFEPMVSISPGLFAEFTFPRLQKKVSFLTEFLYTYSKFSGSTSNGLITTTSTIGYSYLKWNNLIRYKYLVGKIQLFVDGGISIGTMVSNQNHRKTNYFSSYSLEGPVFDDIEKREIGLLIGTGAKMGKFSLELRYEGNGAIALIGSNISSEMKRAYMLLGYRF